MSSQGLSGVVSNEVPLSGITRRPKWVSLAVGLIPSVLGYFVVQSLSRVWLCDTLACSVPGFPIFLYLPEFAQTHVHCWWCCTTISFCRLLLLLSSIFPSIRVFSNESTLTTEGQTIGTSGLASIFPKNIQGYFPLGLNSLILQYKQLSRDFSSTTIRASILQCSAFFMAQISYP